MIHETNFEAIKAEILDHAKIAQACTEQYRRAYKSKTLQELCNVIKDNFSWCFNNKVITPDLLMQYREDFAQNDIFINASVQSGFLLCDNATVKAWGNATVKAWGNAKVEAYNNVTVEAWGNATVEACDNVTVEAWGNATVEACDNVTVKARDNVTVEACDNVTVKARDNVTVEAWGNAYCISYHIIECKLSDNAIYRVYGINTIYYSSDKINFIKQ